MSIQEHHQPRPAAGASHTVHFYGDHDALIERLVQYVADGVAARQTCVVIATEGHRTALQRRLGAAGVVVGHGRLVLLDAAATLQAFMRSGRPDPALFAEHVGRTVRAAAGVHGGVRAYGEMVALLWAYGNAVGALEVEELWNDLQRDLAFPLLCAYPTSDLDLSGGDAVAEICARHTEHATY